MEQPTLEVRLRVSGSLLSTNGTLYLDQALTKPAILDSLLPTAAKSLPLYFKPAHDFNGTVDLKYVAVGAQSGASNAVDFYLTVSGIDGGVDVLGHVGAFAVADFSFDIEALSSWTQGGGASVGKPNPAPLVIDLKPGAHLNDFIANITGGDAFPHVRLEGVTAASDGAQTVYDLRLDGVFMTQVTDTNGVDHLELVYRAVSLTTTEQNPDGSLGASQTTAWDVPTLTTSTTPLIRPWRGQRAGRPMRLTFI